MSASTGRVVLAQSHPSVASVAASELQQRGPVVAMETVGREASTLTCLALSRRCPQTPLWAVPPQPVGVVQTGGWVSTSLEGGPSSCGFSPGFCLCGPRMPPRLQRAVVTLGSGEQSLPVLQSPRGFLALDPQAERARFPRFPRVLSEEASGLCFERPSCGHGCGCVRDPAAEQRAAVVLSPCFSHQDPHPSDSPPCSRRSHRNSAQGHHCLGPFLS